jgi:hypothetical protein
LLIAPEEPHHNAPSGLATVRIDRAQHWKLVLHAIHAAGYLRAPVSDGGEFAGHYLNLHSILQNLKAACLCKQQ